MSAIDQIREILYLVAGLFIWPVMIGLLLLVAMMIIALGTFAREAVDTALGKRTRLDRALARLESIASAQQDEQQHEGGLDLRLERALQDEERQLWRPLAQLRMAVRIGPALGLMGTLIPMAFALQGLAEGDFPSLASNLVTAFASTVIGLAVSVIAYLIATTRENWVRSDTQVLAFRAECLLRTAPSSDDT